MTFQIFELTPSPVLPLTPTTTVYTGTARLGTGRRFITPNEPAQDFGFFVPDAPPLEEGAAPSLWAEGYLMVMVSIGGSGGGFSMGVEQVVASFLPDPRGGSARWLHLGGMAFAPRPIRIGYRITVQDISRS